MPVDDRLASARSAYDLVAESYSGLLPDASIEAPADRGMIEAFASHVNEGGGRFVLDAGCGTGRMIGLLGSLGLSTAGIDMSAGMLEVARRNHPGLDFDVAELAHLPHADQQLDGIFAWYSIIHLEPWEIPGVFTEFFRVLAPGGYVLVSFQAGEGRRHISRAYGHDVSMDAQLFPTAWISEQLANAGFSMVARITREPGRLERSPQAVILARRPPLQGQ